MSAGGIESRGSMLVLIIILWVWLYRWGYGFEGGGMWRGARVLVLAALGLLAGPTLAIQKKYNLTIGYLPSIKGEMRDRQGLAISGALSMALDDVCSKTSHSELSYFRLHKFNISGGSRLSRYIISVQYYVDAIPVLFKEQSNWFLFV